MFESLLDKAGRGEIDRELALKILAGAKESNNAIKLFELASAIRDENLGRDLHWHASVFGTISCVKSPRCKFCRNSGDNSQEDYGPEKLATAAKKMESLGIKQLQLNGGKSIHEDDRGIIEIIRSIRQVSNIDLTVGIDIRSPETIREMKKLGVSCISVSLGTTNGEIFHDATPGNSLEKDKRLLETCESEGVRINSMCHVGIGESAKDRVDLVLYLKSFSRLNQLSFFRFQPFPNSAYHDRPPCSPWDVATTVAVARLLMPKAHLGLAGGSTSDNIPLWYVAGGGNLVQGAVLSRKPVSPGPGEEVIPVADDVFIVNKMPLIKQYFEGMRRSIKSE